MWSRSQGLERSAGAPGLDDVRLRRREYLEQHHPDQFDEAKGDPAVMAAVEKFKRYQDQLAQLRIALGWHVRRDLSYVENEEATAGRTSVLDRDDNEVESFESQKDAARIS